MVRKQKKEIEAGDTVEIGVTYGNLKITGEVDCVNYLKGWFEFRGLIQRFYLHECKLVKKAIPIEEVKAVVFVQEGHEGSILCATEQIMGSGYYMSSWAILQDELTAPDLPKEPGIYVFEGTLRDETVIEGSFRPVTLQELTILHSGKPPWKE